MMTSLGQETWIKMNMERSNKYHLVKTRWEMMRSEEPLYGLSQLPPAPMKLNVGVERALLLVLMLVFGSGYSVD